MKFGIQRYGGVLKSPLCEPLRAETKAGTMSSLALIFWTKYSIPYELCSILIFIQEAFIKHLILSKHDPRCVVRAKMRNSSSLRTPSQDTSKIQLQSRLWKVCLFVLEVANNILSTRRGNTSELNINFTNEII